LTIVTNPGDSAGYITFMILRPDLTVAAIVERDGQFLLVEERVANRMVFN